MRSKNRNPWVLLLLVLVGLVIGGVLGEILKDYIPLIGYSKSIGFDPTLIDLSIIKFTIGLKLSINLASVIGLIISIFIYNKI